MNIKLIIGVAVIFFVLLVFCVSYVKAPPNKAYIISGFRKKPKILIGRAGLKIPFFERKDELLIKQISIDIKTGDYVPSIAKANADRDVAIAQAQAAKESNDAQVLAQTEISIKQNELSIKKSELKTIEDTKKAEADAAYEIQKEAQRKTIEITKTEADIARQEKEVDLKKREADVKEQSLNAEIRKKAEADKFAKQQEADAQLYQRQRNAEAEKFEKQQEAEARKAQAEAELFAKKQEAEGIRAVGEAEAKAIEAKGIAEAEALEKKADAMKKYGQAAMVEMIVNLSTLREV